MSKTSRTVVALVVAFGLLAVMAWFDAVLLRDTLQHGRASFDLGPANLLFSLGSFAVAGSVLLVARVAIGSGSIAVGAVYVVVGGFFALLPWILSTFATHVNDVPPLFPDPLAIAVADVYIRTVGPLNAVMILGAGMAIAGVAVIGRSIRERG